MRLENRVVTLTGATGGIGQALAAALAAAGSRLVLAGRDAAALQALAQRLPAGRVAATCAGDLTDPAARDRLARLAAEQDTSVLINLCGGNCFGLLEQHSDADLAALLAVNLTVPILLTRALLAQLKRHEQALVVNVGSAFGAIGFPGYAAYCASKFGLRGFSEALARELADGPVGVLHVAPRATRTAMNTAAVNALNQALGNAEDSPERVAARIVSAIRRGQRRSAIGWRERLFATLNQTMPAAVDRALAGQLETIKRFANPTQEDHS